MFEQTFENIDDILHKDAGCGSDGYLGLICATVFDLACQ